MVGHLCPCLCGQYLWCCCHVTGKSAYSHGTRGGMDGEMDGFLMVGRIVDFIELN